MDNRKLLVPIDVNKCRPAVFDVVNRFARNSQVTAILLHVVTLNITAAENRIYEGLAREAQSYLEKIAGQFIDPAVITVRQVLIGKAPEQILALSESSHPHVILMTVDKKSLQRNSVWKGLRFSTAYLSRTVNAVLKEAPCDVLVLPTAGDFNSEEVWGRPSNDAPAAALHMPAGRAGYMPAR